MKGLGVSGGIGEGCLIDIEDISQKKAQSVVLVPALDSRIAGLSGVSAIVSNAGGITSHGAVVARELGIPCVVCRSNLEELQATIGKVVRVNGWEGTIDIVSHE